MSRHRYRGTGQAGAYSAQQLEMDWSQAKHGDMLVLADNPHFNGPVYEPKHDHARLTGQILRVFGLMKDSSWRTLSEIEAATGDPAASISAQLRHLRKPRFGGHAVEKRHRGERSAGLWEYRLIRRKT